jgi:hypothetical protein
MDAVGRLRRPADPQRPDQREYAQIQARPTKITTGAVPFYMVVGCRYVYNTPAFDALTCNAPTIDGTWCRLHRALVYQPDPQRLRFSCEAGVEPAGLDVRFRSSNHMPTRTPHGDASGVRTLGEFWRAAAHMMSFKESVV